MIIVGVCFILLTPLMCVFATPAGAGLGFIIGLVLIGAGVSKRERSTKGFRVPRQRFEEIHGQPVVGSTVIGKEFPYEVTGMKTGGMYELTLVEKDNIVLKEIDR